MKILYSVESILTYFRTHFKWSQKESIYFITFHRSGSSFCEKYLLPSVKGLRHIDYASLFYHGRTPPVVFKKKGFLYGPLRLSANPESPVYKKIVEPLFFDNGKTFVGKSIFFIRDPREVLVSSYDAFGWTHGISSSREIARFQLKRQDEIKSLKLDEYVLKYADHYKSFFENLIQIRKTCPNSILLKFEEMIFDWENFLSTLSKFVELDRQGIDRLYKNKKAGENGRSSENGTIISNRFRQLLKQSTIENLDHRFEDILAELSYT